MRIEWRTVALIGAAYLTWGLAGYLVWPVAPPLALALMALMAALHASLVHECIHGHPTRSARVNELLVAACLSLIWPYRRFRTLHMRHHRDENLTDPFEDPESYYLAQWRYSRLPTALRGILVINSTMAGRLVLGPLLGLFALLAGDLRQVLRGDLRILTAWVLHVLGLIPVIYLVVSVFGIPLWLYLITVAWGSMSLIAIRTYAEHRWAEKADGRTIIVEKTPLSWLFLNNNLHIVHHKHPQAPWYSLPTLYAQDREHWNRINDGYRFDNYWQLFRKFAVRPKETVSHPAWEKTRRHLAKTSGMNTGA